MHLYEPSEIDPIKMLEIFTPQQYEEVVLDWVEGYLKKQNSYYDVERLGGTNDKGRDVIAVYDSSRLLWDNYQCKHYSASLSPSDIKKEIAKLCYYTYKKDYPVPQKYFFVAPKALSPEAHDLIYYKKDELKAQIIANWDKDFKKIFLKDNVSMTTELNYHIENNINFDIFSHISPTEFISQHKQTNHYAFRFKQRIKRNPDVEIDAPDDIDYPKEEVYINHLLDAYTDNHKSNITEENLPAKYTRHFKSQRKFFYCAEAIEKITRDACRDDKPFKKLKEDVYNAIIDEVENESYPDGYERLNTCLKEARNCRLSPNEISEAIDSSGQQGICHYLANENKVKWINGVKNENIQ